MIDTSKPLKYKDIVNLWISGRVSEKQIQDKFDVPSVEIIQYPMQRGLVVRIEDLPNYSMLADNEEDAIRIAHFILRKAFLHGNLKRLVCPRIPGSPLSKHRYYYITLARPDWEDWIVESIRTKKKP